MQKRSISLDIILIQVIFKLNKGLFIYNFFICFYLVLFPSPLKKNPHKILHYFNIYLLHYINKETYNNVNLICNRFAKHKCVYVFKYTF